jgi:hypothetical protein
MSEASADRPEDRFSLFQVVSAYTNTGTSLVDQSMVPFQTAYPSKLIRIIFTAYVDIFCVSDLFHDIMYFGWQHCFCEYP